MATLKSVAGKTTTTTKKKQQKVKVPYVNLEQNGGEEESNDNDCAEEFPMLGAPPIQQQWPRSRKTAHDYQSLAGDVAPGGSSSSTAGGVRMRQQQQQRVGMAVFDYKAQAQDELSLSRGSMMEIVKEECGEEGWVLARMDSGVNSGSGDADDSNAAPRVGMVPKLYVALVGLQPELVKPGSVQRSNELLGSGGFADVFRGTYMGQEVALKLSRAAKDGETLKREALILSRLHHENIVRFYGMCLDPLIIVLELCEGGTLFSLGRKMGSSDVLTVINWAKQVASAIEHMHSRDEPLVYADMKAENVLIKERPCECRLHDDSWRSVANYNRNWQCRKCDGLCINQLTLKLADFNVTRNIGVKRESFSGSLPWMSPEVIQNKDAHPSADIWSFGMFFWELHARKVPYNNCEMDVILSTIISKEGLPLPLPDDLPAVLRDVFHGCWRRKDKERPNIGELRSQLERAEQLVDNNYKWVIREEEQRAVELERKKAQAMLENLCCDAQPTSSVNLPLYEGLMFLERFGGRLKKQPADGGIVQRKLAHWFQPPTPAKRQKASSKLDKESIGMPWDFRHKVSAKVRESTVGDALDRIFIIRYTDGHRDQQQYRSHDSLLDSQLHEESGGYCTLPRAFKHQHSRSSDEPQTDGNSETTSRKWTPPVPLLPRKPISGLFGLECRVGQNCCTKLTAKKPFCGGMRGPKSAKSNPELHKLKMNNNISERKTMSNSGGRGKVHPMGKECYDAPPPLPPNHPSSSSSSLISRRHDYLSLLPSVAGHPSHFGPLKAVKTAAAADHCFVRKQPFSAAEERRQQKDRLEPPDWSSGSSGADEFVNILGGAADMEPNSGGVRRLSRANAVRQRVVDTAAVEDYSTAAESPAGSSATTPSGGAEESSSSADLSGFVMIVGDGSGASSEGIPPSSSSRSSKEKGRRKGDGGKQQHQQKLPDIFNRRVSPPSVAGGSSTPAGMLQSSSRRSTLSGGGAGEPERLSQSTFYVSTDPANAVVTDALTPLEEPGSVGGGAAGGGTPRRRSTASSSGGGRSGIAALLPTWMGGGSGGSKSSPRNLDELEEERAEDVPEGGGITVARCFHPHHGSVADAFHLCALRPATALLPEISLRHAHELPEISLHCANVLVKSELTEKPTSTLGRSPQTHHQNSNQNKMFVKRSEYPEKQRQRHRTESATFGGAQKVVHAARSPTKTAEGDRRMSSVMETVIQMRDGPNNGDPNNNYKPKCSLAPPPPPPMSSSTLPRGSCAMRTRADSSCSHSELSSSVLNTAIPIHQQPTPNPSLLSPDRAQLLWHQRSRSSDSPSGAKPASELAELLRRQPVVPPTKGPIVNPSYVPMQENNNNVKQNLPAPSNNAPPHAHSTPQLFQRQQRPVPMPRTSIAKKTTLKVAPNERPKKSEAMMSQWPTSQAPVLNRAEIAASAAGTSSTASAPFPAPSCSPSGPPMLQPVPRPTTLHLVPPPLAPSAPSPTTSSASTPTTSTSLFTNSSNSCGHSSTASAAAAQPNVGGGCDSGMCASSSGTSTEGEGESSPLDPPLHRQKSVNCSATVFSCSPNASPTLVIIGGGGKADPARPVSSFAPRSSSDSAFHRRVVLPPSALPPPPDSAPPPVPRKQYDQQGPRVPPLPRNGRAMGAKQQNGRL